MKENKLVVEINRSVKDVFDYTLNPQNTSKWIPFIAEEVASEWPPKIGTKYKNRGENGPWSEYTLTELEENVMFTLSKSDNKYNVKYIFKPLGKDKTELTYFEWASSGELDDLFPSEILENLKSQLEL